MSYEKKARASHRGGVNCAMSVYEAFREVNLNAGVSPRPRGEGGKCGAVLAAEQTLREMGLENDFDERFIAQFGALKCFDLRRKGVPCNDLVGGAAKLVEEMMK